MTIPRHGEASPQRSYAGWRATGAVLLVAAGAYAAANAYITGEEAARMGECQSRINSEVFSSLQERDNANRNITRAQRALVEARLDPDSGGVGITPRQADEEYLAALDELERTRDANPLEPVARC